MISTLRGTNGTFANVGSVQVQPLPASSPIRQVAQQSTTLLHPSSPGVLPASQALVSFPIISAGVTSTVEPKSSIASIISAMVSQGHTVLPRGSSKNLVMPTYALALEAGRTYDPRVAQGFITTATRFQPYEQLTGIANERPEIVMLTNFQPIFDSDVSHTAPNFIGVFDDVGLYQFMTPAGRYVDAQVTMRNLQGWNAQMLTSALRARYSGLNQQYESRSAAFTKALVDLQSNATFLLNLARIIETQKKQLDLRHDVYAVDPSLAVSNMVNYQQSGVGTGAQKLHSVIQRMVSTSLPAKYDCTDLLVNFGYTLDSVKNVFSSTKIWFQMLVELKSLLQHHSLQLLDLDATYQRSDTNPTTILIPPTKYFGIASNIPVLSSLDELASLSVSNASSTMTSLQSAFAEIYDNAFFKDEEARLAAIAHVLTQEYRYSNGLSQEPVQRALQNFYGFVVVPNGNTTLFDSVIGKFGNNITDFPSANDQSVASFAQNTVGRGGATGVGVLTFESKYVEGDTGSLSPGGDFYFDGILDTDGTQFNTAAIDALTQEADDQASQLNIIIDGLNLMMVPTYPSATAVGTAQVSNKGFLATASDVITEISSKLIDINGNPYPVSLNDRLGSIYTYARDNSRVKTLLFLYTIGRISRSYGKNVPGFTSSLTGDNTPLVDYLVEQLVAELENSVPDTVTSVQLANSRVFNHAINTSSMTTDSVKTALKTGTLMTSFVEQFMSDVISQFRVQSSAIQNNYTRYGGYIDTVVAMLAFDFAISMIARYSNQTIVGQHRGATLVTLGQPTFVVSQTSINHSISFNELLQRTRNETSQVQQLLLTIITVLKNISGSLKLTSNYLNSVEAKQQLGEISTILQGDKDMLRMLFSEQQIMLMASTVNDLAQAVNYGSSQMQGGSYHVAHAGSTSSQAVVVLDESEVSATTRDALYSYFGTGEFASQLGLNKRILTVGIPLGFTQRLKQKINIQEQKRASFENKRNDIVQVVVYKIDVQNADIIYSPRRFLFEMSRFPTRYTTAQWIPLPAHASAQDVVNAIPTQCFTSSLDSSTATTISSGVEYASTSIATNSGVRSAKSAFSDQSYSFLSADQKVQILNNHVASQLLEVYIRLMTGINVAEYNYLMTDVPQPLESEFIKTLTAHAAQYVVDQTKAHVATLQSSPYVPATPGVLFGGAISRPLSPVSLSFANRASSSPITSNPAGVAGRVSAAAAFRSVSQANISVKTVLQQAPETISTNVATLNFKGVPIMHEHLTTIVGISNTVSTVSPADAISRRVMTPKQFDRVFNIAIDPRDFNIDVEKTMATPYGRQALDLMLQHGDIVSDDSDSAALDTRFGGLMNVVAAESILEGRGFSNGGAQPNVNNFKFRDRDKSQGDLIADKYFVTIETLGEEEV